MLSPEGHVPQRAAACCSSYPPAPAAHLQSTRRTQELSRCLRGGLKQRGTEPFSCLLGWNKATSCCLSLRQGGEDKQAITISSPSERISLLQNTVILHGSTWLLCGKCPGGKSKTPAVRVLLDILKTISSQLHGHQSYSST